jgi:hypothetical protein
LVNSDKNFRHSTRNWRRDFSIDFVGRDLKERFVNGNLIAFVFQPPSDGALGNALSQRWHHNIKRHLLPLYPR